MPRNFNPENPYPGPPPAARPVRSPVRCLGYSLAVICGVEEPLLGLLGPMGPCRQVRQLFRLLERISKVLGWLTIPDWQVMAAPAARERVRVPSHSEYVLQS